MNRLLATLAVLAAFPLICAFGDGGSCASTRVPPVRTVEVLVPVAQPCPDKRGPKPDYVDTVDAIKAKTKEGSDALVALLLGGREQRIEREKENDGQIGACAAPAG